MRRSFTCFVCIAITCLCANFVCGASSSTAPEDKPTASAPQKAPSINIAETTFNFGDVMEGTEVAHDFLVKNEGTEPLQIEQVRPG